MGKKEQSGPRLRKGVNPDIPRFKNPFGGETFRFSEILGMFQHRLISKHEVRAVLWDQKAELYIEEVLALVQYGIIKKREAREVLWGD